MRGCERAHARNINLRSISIPGAAATEAAGRVSAVVMRIMALCQCGSLSPYLVLLLIASKCTCVGRKIDLYVVLLHHCRSIAVCHNIL